MRALRLYAAALLLLGAGCNALRLERPPQLRPGDWPTFAGNASRSSQSAQEIVPPLTQDWELDVGSGTGNGAPIVTDSLLFLSDMRGELHVVQIRTGKEIGSVRLGEAIQGSPVIEGSTVVVAATNTRESLVAYSLMEGKVQWRRECGDIEVSPLLMDGRVYLGNLDGTLSCVQRFDGTLLWNFAIPQNTQRKGIRATPAGAEGLVVFGADDGRVYALDAQKGTSRWSHATGAAITTPVVIVRGTVLAGNIRGMLTAMTLDSGATRWRFQSGAPLYAHAAVNDSLAIVADLAGIVTALRLTDGTPLWTARLDGPVNAGALIAGNTVYLGTLNKVLCALRLTDGSLLWTLPVDGRIKTSPVAAGRRLLVVTDEWTLFAFREVHQ